ncbi:hypothetical protein B7494_g1073 [Chlorociboria aeruginascens]|nr:hypothetical protein B7494_g1073 [Chlorociboria aeruginascens]
MAPGTASDQPTTQRFLTPIESLLNGLIMPGLTIDESAILIALAHCTGWSADRISCTLEDATFVTKTPEEIWDYYQAWESSREGEEIDNVKEERLMRALMRNVGVQKYRFRDPLSTTVRFPAVWISKDKKEIPLLPNFTLETRKASKQIWYNSESSTILGQFTHLEEVLISQFGWIVVSILKEILQRWDAALCESLEGDADFRPIKKKKQADLVMLHLRYFHLEYERKYGRMEHAKSPATALFKRDVCHIKSTGYGIKLFLGFMMVDRLNVVNWKLKAKRENIGFLELNGPSLEGQDCPVCHEPLDPANPDGAQENSLKLVICCRQTIGEECLKLWLSGRDTFGCPNETCPVCRYKFPNQFLNKLYGSEAKAQARGKAPTVILAAPNPTPEPDVQKYLDKTDISRLLAETLTADVEPVFTDETSFSKDSNHTYVHFNRSRDADLFEDFCKDKLPDDEIYVPPHNQPINPEDEDDVVPDQHAAFGIQRATQKTKEAAWKDLGLAELMKKGPGEKSTASGSAVKARSKMPR